MWWTQVNDSKCRLNVTKYRMNVTKYRLNVPNKRMNVTKYRLHVPKYRLNVTKYRLCGGRRYQGNIGERCSKGRSNLGLNFEFGVEFGAKLGGNVGSKPRGAHERHLGILKTQEKSLKHLESPRE